MKSNIKLQIEEKLVKIAEEFGLNSRFVKLSKYNLAVIFFSSKIKKTPVLLLGIEFNSKIKTRITINLGTFYNMFLTEKLVENASIKIEEIDFIKAHIEAFSQLIDKLRKNFEGGI